MSPKRAAIIFAIALVAVYAANRVPMVARLVGPKQAA